MRVSRLAVVKGENINVQDFIRQILDNQFADVRGMLQLPRPDVGIEPACNYSIVSSLTNLISGLSVTIFKPKSLLEGSVRSKYGSGQAFQDLVRDYFPYTPSGITDFPKKLYKIARNPMAHSLGVLDKHAPKQVFFTRIFDPTHDGVGWNDKELEDLENPFSSYSFPYQGITIESEVWTIHCDAFYIDVIEMLRNLTSDVDQMNAAENRFKQRAYVWRNG